jgi:hypothetical protein
MGLFGVRSVQLRIFLRQLLTFRKVNYFDFVRNAGELTKPNNSPRGL